MYKLFFAGRSRVNPFNIWWRSIDKPILFIALILICIGIVLVTTASPFIAHRLNIPQYHFVYRHLLFSLLAIFTIIFMSTRSYQQSVKLIKLLFYISLILLVLIPVLGFETKGARRWFSLYHMSIQPSEFIKVTFPIIITELLYSKKMIFNNKYILPTLLYVVISVLLLLQPDFGMFILISGMFLVMIILSGIRIFWILLGINILMSAVFISYFSLSHVHYRVSNFFMGGQSYQVTKSLTAIQQGGLFGKGIGIGNIKQYIPDVHTDFIFAVSIEEYGMVFGILLLLAYFYIGYRAFKYSYSYDILLKFIVINTYIFLLYLQVLIHVGSNINLIPTKGVTLPLISYGGSSLLSTAFIIGILLSFTSSESNIFKNNLK